MDFIRETRWILERFDTLTEFIATPAAQGDGDSGSGCAELWRKAAPRLEKARASLDRMESADLPERSLVGPSRESCQKEIDNILDAVIVLLETSEASESRSRIRELRQAVSATQENIAQYREQAATAPSKVSLTLPQSMWIRSRESLDAAIVAEIARADKLRAEIQLEKEAFCRHLGQIGILTSGEEAEALVMSVAQDDVVSMAAATAHIATISSQLEQLANQSGEAPLQTRRYTGCMFCWSMRLCASRPALWKKWINPFFPNCGASKAKRVRTSTRQNN